MRAVTPSRESHIVTLVDRSENKIPNPKLGKGAEIFILATHDAAHALLSCTSLAVGLRAPVVFL